MATIKVTSDDGMHVKVSIDGKPVTHAVSANAQDRVPTFVLEELDTAEHGAVRRTTEWHLGSLTLEAESVI